MRINTSGAFFLSIEFQQTGNLVYKMYKAGFGNLTGKPVAVDRAPFLADTRQIQSTLHRSSWDKVIGRPVGNEQASLCTGFCAAAGFSICSRQSGCGDLRQFAFCERWCDSDRY